MGEPRPHTTNNPLRSNHPPVVPAEAGTSPSAAMSSRRSPTPPSSFPQQREPRAGARQGAVSPSRRAPRCQPSHLLGVLSMLESPLPLAVWRRRLTAFVVAPAGNAAVQPHAARVQGACSYRREPFALRSRSRRIVAHSVQARGSDCCPLFESLRIGAPACGRSIQSKPAGMMTSHGNRRKRPLRYWGHRSCAVVSPAESRSRLNATRTRGLTRDSMATNSSSGTSKLVLGRRRRRYRPSVAQ